MTTRLQPKLIHADVLDWLANYDSENQPKAHAVLSDPPYGLEFMGREWDKPKPSGSVLHDPAIAGGFQDGRGGNPYSRSRIRYGISNDFQAWVTEWAELLLNAVYPGALGLFFGGTRTYHRLASGLEDAGWEVVDCIMYCYGSGFPKSHSVGKAIDKSAGAEREVVGQAVSGKTAGMQYLGPSGIRGGEYDITAPATAEAAAWEGYGTALKPSYEPVVVCRAPRGNYTFAELARQFGTGAFNIDGGRIGTEEQWGGNKENAHSNYSGKVYGRFGEQYAKPSHELGRWPANLILDDHAAAALDAMSGESVSRAGDRGKGINGATFKYQLASDDNNMRGHEDSGGASRFFYTAKAPSWEREAGLAGFPLGSTDELSGGGGFCALDTQTGIRAKSPRRCTHPTLKPISLTEYLARLILPPAHIGPRRILIPFAGVGSEMIGAHLAGWEDVVGIERDAEYIPQGEARLRWWGQYRTYQQAESAYCGEQVDARQEANGQLSLLAFVDGLD